MDGAIAIGQSAPVHAVALSPDGKLVVIRSTIVPTDQQDVLPSSSVVHRSNDSVLPEAAMFVNPPVRLPENPITMSSAVPLQSSST